MRYLIIFIGVFVLFGISFAAEDVIVNITQSDTTIIDNSSTTESAIIQQETSNETTQPQIPENNNENSSTNSDLISTTTESLGEIVIETSSSPNSNPNPPNRRKTILINQQQNGKMNVQLELSDVSVIVIPNQKENPQLSLLNLLFKTAQKRQNEDRKKEENAMKSSDYHHDQYSKIHSSRPSNEDSYINEPFIESRAPYRVDISSTLGQQPVVEISPHSHPRKLKRAIDSRLLGMITTEIDQQNTLGEDPIVNILRGEEEEALIDRNESEFHLLGATENCGPGRKRNSYQICVPIDYDDEM
jgi:hypothetical protein